jgi:CRP-like cAMP-binding protein
LLWRKNPLTNFYAEQMVRKLRMNSVLSDEDVSAIYDLPFIVRELPARTAISREGDRPAHTCLVVSGLLCRAKMTHDGKRQLLSFHISGDIPDLQSLHLPVMDHDLIALSDAKVAFIAHEPLRLICRERPELAEALWRETLIDASVFREWIMNVGRRDATQRMMHLLFEVGCRMQTMGLGEIGSFHMPITQNELADALGLTPIHVNRVLQNLRQDGVLDFKRSLVTISNVDRVAELSDFDPLYLHQSCGESRMPPASDGPHISKERADVAQRH